MFLVALSFAYFAKALSGSYMKSTITQLERRFDIPSYLIGVIDGSFEIGESSVTAVTFPPLSPCCRWRDEWPSEVFKLKKGFIRLLRRGQNVCVCECVQ